MQTASVHCLPPLPSLRRSWTRSLSESQSTPPRQVQLPPSLWHNARASLTSREAKTCSPVCSAATNRGQLSSNDTNPRSEQPPTLQLLTQSRGLLIFYTVRHLLSVGPCRRCVSVGVTRARLRAGKTSSSAGLRKADSSDKPTRYSAFRR